MIELGKRQNLTVVKKVDFGVYLAENEQASAAGERVLLPNKQVPEGTGLHDTVNVFIYKDSQDRRIATCQKSLLEMGQIALLRVVSVSKIGAFLDWGLEKDLFLPFKEQTVRVREGDECLVTLYVDKSERLCATMKLYHSLHTDSPYKEGDTVRGRVYEISDNFGVFLAVDLAENEQASAAGERVLLPNKQVPEGTGLHDTVNVFIYKDSQDRRIATCQKSLLEMGQIALLRVVSVSKIGAFLDWGLEKDLFLPFKEQTVRVREGDECLVTLYVDKSERLCATMKLYHSLHTDSPYKEGDTVRGRVYEISDNFGVFLAVDHLYSALIPKKEAQGKYRPGDEVTVRVVKVREDGKLTVSPHQKAYLQMDVDCDNIMQVLDEFAGVLPFDDHVSPEVIKREFGISKAAFKRAVGRLLKEEKITIRDGRIYRL